MNQPRFPLVIAMIVFALLASVMHKNGWAQNAGSPPNAAAGQKEAPVDGAGATAPAQNPLASEQAQLADRFKRLENLLLKSSEIEAASNPARAALLQQAAQLGKQAQLSDLLAKAAKNLEQNQYSQAVESQKISRDSLKQLLELLQSENRTDRVREQRDEVRRLIEEVDRLRRLQSSLRGRTEGGGQTDKAASDQQKLAEKASQLAQEINGDKSGDESQADASKDPADQSKDGQSKDGQSKDDKSKADKNSNSKDSNKSADDKQGQDGNSDASKSDASKSDASGKSGDKKPEDKKPADKNADNKNADDKKADDKDPKGKDTEGQSSDNKPTNDKAGDQKSGDPKSGDPKSGDPKSGEQKSGEQKSDSQSPSESKDASEQQSSESGKSQSKSPQQSQPQDGNQSSGGKSQEQEESEQSQQQQQPQSPMERGAKGLKRAQQRMQEAQKELESAHREGAVEKQREAEKELQAAIEQLEEILRQLREEEIERSLAALEDRLRLMLSAQNKVFEETKRLQEIGGASNDRSVEIRARKLADDERKVLNEGQRALLLLREEGTSAAFPEAMSQILVDVQSVAERLDKADTGKLTVSIEQEIVTSLEELIEALVAVQKEQKDKKQKQQQSPGQQQNQQGEQPLVDQLAEMRLIKTLQLRVNKRTETLSTMLQNPDDVVGQAEAEDIATQIRELSGRQANITQVTRDIVNGKNQ